MVIKKMSKKVIFDANTVQDCLWCEANDRKPHSMRADGLPVFNCTKCGHKAVQIVPSNLSEMYQDDTYFDGYANEAQGYNDYESIPPTHWFTELCGALILGDDIQNPSVLDVGCAMGMFLNSCKNFGWKPFGIDISEQGKEKCAEKGIPVIADFLEDVDPAKYPANIVTAFHIIEHLTNFATFFERINTYVANGSRFYFVFPNVDFSNHPWNGYAVNPTHISYFNQDFVANTFPTRLPSLKSVLHTNSLVYGFAGDLPPNVLKTIELTRTLCQMNAAEDSASLREAIKQLSPTGVGFVSSFLARANSAALSLDFLNLAQEIHRAAPYIQWLAISRAIAFMQNGNVYGAATALHQYDGKNPGLTAVAEKLKQDMPRQLKVGKSETYPKISLWFCCSSSRPITEDVFLSAGDQTYPFFEILHVQTDTACNCKIPDSFKALVKTVTIDSSKNGHSLDELYSYTNGSVILSTDGSLKLSKYCLFALYDILLKEKNAFVIPSVSVEGKQDVHFPGKRTLTNLFKKFVLSVPPLIMFRKENSKLFSPEILANPQLLRSQNVQMLECPDVVAFRRG